MKRFFLRLRVLIIIPLIIATVNYMEDPANLFNDKYEKGIVQYLVKGDYVTDITFNYDERLLQKLFIKQMTRCPDEIVLGSSRVNEINRGFTGNPTSTNHWMSKATLEDAFAIYYLYEKKKCKVRKLIFGVDPWILNDASGLTKWEALAPEYYTFLNKLTGATIQDDKASKHRYSKYKQLLAMSYFKVSVDYMINGKGKKFRATRQEVNDEYTLLSDGSVYYGTAFRNSTVEYRRKDINDIITHPPISNMGDYTRLSPHYVQLFTAFIEYLQRNQTEVEFYFPPYHPDIWDYFKRDRYYDIVNTTEQFFKDFASTHHIKTIGSYNPYKYGFNDAYFYDGLHCNREAIKKMTTIDGNF